jgi:hypothetical protein
MHFESNNTSVQGPGLEWPCFVVQSFTALTHGRMSQTMALLVSGNKYTAGDTGHQSHI